MLLYQFVGPGEIASRVSGGGGMTVLSMAELVAALIKLGMDPDETSFTVTYVVNSVGHLVLADRRSEHVACASGQPVQSAGEMTFAHEGDDVIVESVTNQSTGYCPESESWDSVASALDSMTIKHPGGFNPAIVFRRCQACNQTNVVKDNWFYCQVCEAPLPMTWNYV